MRNKPSPEVHSKKRLSLNQVMKLVTELRERIERLELREDKYAPYIPDNLSPPPRKPRMGRKPKLETDELLGRWKRLTTWLEQNWPRLLVPMRDAECSGSASEAIAAILAVKEHGISGIQQPRFYQTPEEFEEALGAFFKSKRYRGNPRNLAAAMAGLPELSWKRSFDICTAHPYKTGHALQAYWDYMHRNFPDRLRELEEAETELNVKIVLARSRTADPLYLHLRDHPGKVKEWLQAGKPIAPDSLGNCRLLA